MSALLPQHFALSEAVVVAAGAFAMARTAPTSRWFALGMAPFALAALVGTIRIALGLSGEIEAVHQFLSRAGALFGLGCLVAVLLARLPALPPLLGLGAAGLAIMAPATLTPLFAAFILLGVMAAWRRNPGRAGLAAGSFALLLFARLGTDLLRADQPALAWHMFHLLVALWLVLLALFVLPQPSRAGSAG